MTCACSSARMRCSHGSPTRRASRRPRRRSPPQGCATRRRGRRRRAPRARAAGEPSSAAASCTKRACSERYSAPPVPPSRIRKRSAGERLCPAARRRACRQAAATRRRARRRAASPVRACGWSGSAAARRIDVDDAAPGRRRPPRAGRRGDGARRRSAAGRGVPACGQPLRSSVPRRARDVPVHAAARGSSRPPTQTLTAASGRSSSATTAWRVSWRAARRDSPAAPEVGAHERRPAGVELGAGAGPSRRPDRTVSCQARVDAEVAGKSRSRVSAHGLRGRAWEARRRRDPHAAGQGAEESPNTAPSDSGSGA